MGNIPSSDTLFPVSPIPAVPDFSDVYTSGTIILLNPIESNAIFLTAAGLCGSIEYLFDISSDVDSTYYHQLFEVITEETLVFGVVQLFMTLISSLTRFREAWEVMLLWAQLLMVYMAVWLTIFVLLVASHNSGEREYWKQYETQRMHSSGAHHDDREKLYKRCVKKMKVTLYAYEYTKSVNFCDYLAVFEKKYVVQLMDLSWKSWLSMVITAVANALRARLTESLLTADVEWQRFLPAVLYIILNGIFPLFFYFGVTNTLSRRLNQYLELGKEKYETRLDIIESNKLEPDPEKHEEVKMFDPSDLQDPQSFLIWQSLEVTLTVIQVSILQIVWYFSVLIISILGPLAQLEVYYLIIAIVVGLIPGIVLWRTLSWTITLVAILSSLEVAADRELLDELCGITKEERKKEEEEKKRLEQEEAEAEQKRQRAEDLGITPTDPNAAADSAQQKLGQELEYDEDGRVKVVKSKKRPIEFDDFSMSRIAIDRREALKRYDELYGVKL